MGRHNVLHGQVGHIRCHHAARQARTEESDDPRHRTASLSATALVRTLQAPVDHGLEVHRDGRSDHGALREVLGQWEPGCTSITTYLKPSACFPPFHTV